MLAADKRWLKRYFAVCLLLASLGLLLLLPAPAQTAGNSLALIEKLARG